MDPWRHTEADTKPLAAERLGELWHLRFALSAAGKTFQSAVVDLSATGVVVAGVPGKLIKVFAVKVLVDSALQIAFASNNTPLEGLMAFTANGGCVENVEPPAFLFATAVGEPLKLLISGTGNARGRVSYWDDDGE